jgi:nucleoid-associated protein YgaU
MSPFAGEDSELAQADDALERDRVIEDDWPAEVHERTHRIVDGDTLRRLAQRYLGNAERFGEIYEANRDVLNNPDLLPIGKVLRLPERAGSAKGRLRQPIDDDRQARQDEQTMPPMIPIPRGPLRISTE